MKLDLSDNCIDRPLDLLEDFAKKRLRTSVDEPGDPASRPIPVPILTPILPPPAPLNPNQPGPPYP